MILHHVPGGSGGSRSFTIILHSVLMEVWKTDVRSLFYCMNIFKRRPWFVTVFLSVAQFASLSSVRVNSLPRYYNFVIHDHYNNGRFPRFSQNRNGMLSWPWMASDGSASFSCSFFTWPKRSAPSLFTVPCLIIVLFYAFHDLPLSNLPVVPHKAVAEVSK